MMCLLLTALLGLKGQNKRGAEFLQTIFEVCLIPYDCIFLILDV